MAGLSVRREGFAAREACLLARPRVVVSQRSRETSEVLFRRDAGRSGSANEPRVGVLCARQEGPMFWTSIVIAAVVVMALL